MIAVTAAAGTAVFCAATAVGAADALVALLFILHDKHHAATQNGCNDAQHNNIYKAHQRTSFPLRKHSTASTAANAATKAPPPMAAGTLRLAGETISVPTVYTR